MTAALFSEYISGRKNAEKLGFEELKTLVIQYPYCRQLRYLLAQKALTKSSEKDNSAELQMASVSANNRKSFFGFITKKKRAFARSIVGLVKNFPGNSKKKDRNSDKSETAHTVTVIANTKPAISTDQKDKQLEEKNNDTKTTAECNDVKISGAMKRHREELPEYVKWLKHLKRPLPTHQEADKGEEEQPVISETLARLLVRQGKAQEAVRMIQQLILLNPEKKTYFASLIEEVKQEN